MLFLDRNDLDINNLCRKDGSIINDIRTNVISRKNFCRGTTKEQICNLVKLPERMEITEERLEILTDVYL